MPCPICKRSSEKAFRPFCSKRCADVDLAKWFNGSYAIPPQDQSDVDLPEDQLPEDARDKPH
ncbi:DNA gyrase inhibitor YacG [Cognatiyoonia sp. IB215446]|uniref:DNA gyrase inhibitor YacG n=1 Tax=Cognatiyoonia sp. IB215446 TaxID=3097355 RepID=UPI002A1654B1|nr:DNA gyrase inhibitor YacG [Cognatiyoonia sp. IB215446]MDX8347361.1 DNA gyrase inhibitor YacG [Cognatiyoonia sp. IB215446]